MIKTLHDSRAKFGLFRNLLGRIPWEWALEGKGFQENWLIFKGHFLQAQEQLILMSKKLSTGDKKIDEQGTPDKTHT